MKLFNEDNHVPYKACRLSCRGQSMFVENNQPRYEVAESECPWEENEVMASESSSDSKQPTTNIENKQRSLSRATIRHKNYEPEGETEKLLDVLELEEFRFLERKVKKEVEGTETKVTNSSSPIEVIISRLPATSKVPKTNFNCNISFSPDQSSLEGNDKVKQLRQMPYGEPMYEFDDRSTWSEEYQQGNQSQGQAKISCTGTRDIITSRACLKQEPIAQCVGDPMSKLVRSYFLPGKSQKGTVPKAGISPTEGKNTYFIDGDLVLQKKVEALEAEILKFQTETRKVQQLIKIYEEKASQLYSEKTSWEQRKNADMQNFQEYKDEQMRKVKKHHKTLEKLSQEMLQLPTKKERNQIEDLKATLSDMKEDHSKKESRWRLTERRLRGIIDELNGQSTELQDEIKRYEERLHQEWQKKDSISTSKCERGTSIDYNILSISMREMSDYVLTDECTSYHQTTGVNMSHEAFEAMNETPYIFDSQIGMSTNLNTRDMMAMYHTSQLKGGRRIDNTTVTKLTEEDCTMYATRTKFNKSSQNCLMNSLELEGKSMENGRNTQQFEPSTYLSTAEWQSACRPQAMQLGSSGKGQSACRSQPVGSMKIASQNGCNSKTLIDSTAISIASRGILEDRQHDINNNFKGASVTMNNTQHEEHVLVDDCVCFANGDIKNTLPDGSIEYYYSEVDTWHTTQLNGAEIFYFPDYQVEEHWPNGQKKIISPDGNFYVIGCEQG